MSSYVFVNTMRRHELNCAELGRYGYGLEYSLEVNYWRWSSGALHSLPDIKNTIKFYVQDTYVYICMHLLPN